MRPLVLRLTLVTLLIGTFCGCRAMSKGGGPPAPEQNAGTPTPPAATPQESKPAPPTVPTPQTQTNRPSDVADVFVLQAALGREFLPLIDGGLLIFEKAATKGTETPNILLEGGKMTLNQSLQKTEGGQGTIAATGAYQKLGTTSGETALYANKVIIDFNFNALQIKSPCDDTISLSGNLRCTLNGTYTYGTHILNGSGQCMTHSGGSLDNLRLDINGTPHKVRYNLGYKVNGDPSDWRSYQWSGAAFVGGIKADLTHLANQQDNCNK